jgi:CRISPR/Cas system CSM-associated protein Csm2 small subunit
MFKFENVQNFQSKKKNKTNRTREEPNKKDKKAIKLNQKELRPEYQRHLGRDMLLSHVCERLLHLRAGR